MNSRTFLVAGTCLRRAYSFEQWLLLARSVSSLRRNHTSEVGMKPTCQQSSTEAFDPLQTCPLEPTISFEIIVRASVAVILRLRPGLWD